MRHLLIAGVAAGIALLPLGAAPAHAKGCLKGAAVGGVAGHMAGHGVLGAAAGCAIGHHEANKNGGENQQSQTAPSQESGASRQN